MASITTTPNANIINIFPFPNIIQSASGSSSNATTNAVASLQSYLNTSNASLTVNSISASSGSNVTCSNNFVVSNAALYINNTSIWNAKSLGVGTVRPVATLDVVGTALIHSTLSVSSSIYASGDLYANGVYYPSDERFKKDLTPYSNTKHVEPVRFKWKAGGALSGKDDIGVIAQNVWEVEPACVHSTSAGTLTVDYAKLVVLCLAELRDLRSTVQALTRV